MLHVNNKPVHYVRGNGKPISLYQNNTQLMGWKWDEQTGTDMPFEATYNDRVDVVALGRSKQAQTQQGKNLLDMDRIEYGSITATGIHIETNTRIKTLLIPVTPNASCSYIIPAGYTRVNTHAYDASQNWVMAGVTTTPAAAAYVRIIFARTDNGAIDAVELATLKALQWGFVLSSTPPSYEPFVPNSPSPDYPSPIISANGDLVVEGRNLCPNTINKINVPYNQGNNTIIDWPSFPYGSGMYIVSCFLDATNAPTGDLRIQYALYADNGTTIEDTNYASKRYGQAPGRVSQVFTAIKGRRVRLYITRSSSLPENTLITAKDAMLERGPVSHRYTPYHEPVTLTLPELRAIPDGAGGWAARDREYIARVDNEWHKFREQRVGRKVFTGGETVSGYGQATPDAPGLYSYRVVQNEAANSSPLCTHYKGESFYGFAWLRSSVGVTVNNANMASVHIIFCTIHATAGDFKSYLRSQYISGTPVTVDYVLATPITTDLGPIDLPSYYPYTRLCIVGNYPPDVTARCRVADYI